VFDRYENNFRVFQAQGDRYQAVSLPQPQFWFEALQLGLGVWQGAYQGVSGLWLRWYDETGDWIPTQAERAEQERQRADQAEHDLEQERRSGQLLLEKLKAKGINLDEL
jgi:hypothetical protein